jgi:hypothetical protein
VGPGNPQHAQHVGPDNPIDEQPAEPLAFSLGQLQKACRFRLNDPRERDIAGHRFRCEQSHLCRSGCCLLGNRRQAPDVSMSIQNGF